MAVTALRDYRKPLIAASLIVLLLAAIRVGLGDTGSTAKSRSGSSSRAVEVELPAQILGLNVQQEDVSQDIASLKTATYVSSAALFTMREGEELQASLQIAGLNDLARPESDRFRRQVIGLMGTSSQELRIGDDKVYMGSGNQQILYTWFRGRGFFVLTARKTYPFRRTLLRRLLPLEAPQ